MPEIVVFVTGQDPRQAWWGGHPSYVRAHARAARRAGFAPHVFCVHPEGGTIETDFGVLHRTRPPTGFEYVPGFRFRRHLMIWRFGLMARAVTRFVLTHGLPRVLHSFGVYGWVGIVAARALRRHGVEVLPIVSAYDTLIREGLAKLRGVSAPHGRFQRLSCRAELLWKRLVVGRYERRGYAEAGAVLVNYESVRRLLIETYGITINVRKIPYSSEAAFLTHPILSQLPPGIEGLERPDAPLIVAVSRHDPRKGLDVLLHALARLRAAGVAFRACLVGDGPLLGAHRRLAEQLDLAATTAIVGFVPDSYAYLKCADVFVLPSLEEGSGSLSLLEALQAGVAVVASNVDGIPEDVEQGDSALLVRPADSGDLTEALEQVLTDPDLRKRLAHRARDTFETRFSAEAFTAALGKVYAELGSSVGVSVFGQDSEERR